MRLSGVGREAAEGSARDPGGGRGAALPCKRHPDAEDPPLFGRCACLRRCASLCTAAGRGREGARAAGARPAQRRAVAAAVCGLCADAAAGGGAGAPTRRRPAAGYDAAAKARRELAAALMRAQDELALRAGKGGLADADATAESMLRFGRAGAGARRATRSSGRAARS